MYGAYHHITVLGKENEPCDHKYDVVGSLCENNDKFAIDRMLPKIDIGDLLVIHDTGAHGFSMGYNYNGRLRSAEILLQPDGSTRLIRRAETGGRLFRHPDLVTNARSATSGAGIFDFRLLDSEQFPQTTAVFKSCDGEQKRPVQYEVHFLVRAVRRCRQSPSP